MLLNRHNSDVVTVGDLKNLIVTLRDLVTQVNTLDPTTGTVDVNTITELTPGSGTTFTTKAIFSVPNFYSYATGITAFAGGGQGSATQLVAEYNHVNTVVTTGDSIKLPTAAGGEHCVVFNDSTNALDCYPTTGQSINELAANTAVSVAGKSMVAFYAEGTNWTTDNQILAAITSIKAPTFSTTTAATNLSINGNTIQGAGTDANVDVNILAKNSGIVWVNANHGVNASGTFVPLTDNTYDYGNEANNARDIHASRSFVKKGIASTQGYGLEAIKSISASRNFAGGPTENIAIQIPSGAKIIGVQLRTDTVIVLGGGGVTWSAAYNTGSTQSIATAQATTINVKVNKQYDSKADADVLSAATDITITPNAGTLDSGTITAVAYYYDLTSLTDAV